MHIQHYLVLAVLTVTSLLSGTAPPFQSQPASDAHSAYIEPSLMAPGQALRSVIVSGTHRGDATIAVQRIGGQVTADLAIINAVAATISSDRLTTLATLPGIVSIVNDKGIKSSGDPCLAPGRCSTRPGWATDTRVKRQSYGLDGKKIMSNMPLPDGSFVSVTEESIVIVNANGSERLRRTLANLTGGLDERFDSAPAIGSDGTIYLAGYVPSGKATSWHVYAINPVSAATRWVFRQAEQVGYVVTTISPNGTLYAAAGTSLYAIDQNAGTLRWSYQLNPTVGYTSGPIVTAPSFDQKGWLYVVATAIKKNVVASHLYAINPDAGLLPNGNWNTAKMGQWVFRANDNDPIIDSPTITPGGIIILTSSNNQVYSVQSANGAQVSSTVVGGKSLAPRIVGYDGTVYLALDGGLLVAVNSDGTQRFRFQAPKGVDLANKPVLSPDQQTIYAASDTTTLYAINTATGIERWRYDVPGRFKIAPSVDAIGVIYASSDASDLSLLSPDGKLINRLTLDSATIQPVRALPTGQVLAPIGGNSLVAIDLPTNTWNGGNDIEPTETKREWKLSNPVGLDVGANELHNNGITGKGVTVAVIDSGVYFSSKVKASLGDNLRNQFLGQADFVNGGLCVGHSGTQYPLPPEKDAPAAYPNAPSYCFSDKDGSIDLYGHGSHVAGIIWSQITDYASNTVMGVAPDANILSVRVLNEDGQGTYTDVIKGIQYAITNKNKFNVKVINLSMSAQATVPYFADPLNRAVEQAWANGIVVVTAAGNSGPGAETITVPGNDPYVITVGAISSNRTPGYWADDILPTWSATGPTADGFAKPDILAPGSNIISFMFTDKNDLNSARLARMHPDYAIDKSSSLFRMSGTSMATAVTSGVAALMIQANPQLLPDQIKFRLMDSARPAMTIDGKQVYSTLQQGAGRIWAPAAVSGDFAADGRANQGMDINADLAAGYATEQDLAAHYQGPIQRTLSNDGQTYLYSVQEADGTLTGVGASRSDTMAWVDWATLISNPQTWSVGRMTWSVANNWDGGMSLAAGRMTWSVGRMTWSVGRMTWSVGRMTWSVGRMTWSVNTTWSSGANSSASAINQWSNSSSLPGKIASSTIWVNDE